MSDFCVHIYLCRSDISNNFSTGLVETDPEEALAGFGEVVRMEPDKAEW